MNKQEFQQKLKGMEPPKIFTYISAHDAYKQGFEKAKGTALFNSYFLDEPEKPVVPRFVAVWYEEHKNELDKLIYLTINTTYRKANAEDKAPLSAFEIWLMEVDNSIETLVLMHHFGYKVEKEKLYTAKLKSTGEYMHLDRDYKDFYHIKASRDVAQICKHYHFTRIELMERRAWENDAYEVEEVIQ